jgi:hypothetical protein
MGNVERHHIVLHLRQFRMHLLCLHTATELRDMTDWV